MGYYMKALNRKTINESIRNRIALESEIFISVALLALSDMGADDKFMSDYINIYRDILEGNAEEFGGETLRALREELSSRGIMVEINERSKI